MIRYYFIITLHKITNLNNTSLIDGDETKSFITYGSENKNF